MSRPHPPAARASLVAALLPISLAGLVSACSHGSGPEPGTPLEALVEFNRALGAGDREAARHWCLSGPLQEETLENTFTMMEAARAFQQKIIGKWGEAEMQRFLEQPGAMLHIDFQVPEQALLEAQILDMGSVAYATMEGGMRVRVVRTPEGWRFDGVGTEDPREIAGIRAQQQLSLGIAQILRRAIEKADEKGMTPELLDLQLGRVLSDHEIAFMEELQRAAQQQQQAPSNEVGPAPPPR